MGVWNIVVIIGVLFLLSSRDAKEQRKRNEKREDYFREEYRKSMFNKTPEED